MQLLATTRNILSRLRHIRAGDWDGITMTNRRITLDEANWIDDAELLKILPNLKGFGRIEGVSIVEVKDSPPNRAQRRAQRKAQA
jgi:hypothetical protein